MCRLGNGVLQTEQLSHFTTYIPIRWPKAPMTKAYYQAVKIILPCSNTDLLSKHCLTYVLSHCMSLAHGVASMTSPTTRRMGFLPRQRSNATRSRRAKGGLERRGWRLVRSHLRQHRRPAAKRALVPTSSTYNVFLSPTHHRRGNQVSQTYGIVFLTINSK